MMKFFGKEPKLAIKTREENSDNVLLEPCALIASEPPHSLSDAHKNFVKEVLLGAVCAAVLLPIGLTISYIEYNLRLVLERPWGERTDLGALDFWFVLSACIYSPLIEELIFRGILTRGIRSLLETTSINQSSAKAISAASSALLFATAHSYGSVSSRFFSALAAELLVHKTEGRLTAAVANHMTHNAIITASVALFSR
ncbi:CPBP family intramembrane glutamic endopeptidase [Legionella worsleiensis]|uniref:CAAX amino terminal protease self-immunity n=1 Tax=Legionella worsleiensis TaxID=45076 RepID=A0A0W1AJN2_9GAMM|nr:CPBP family intramembrane glutamic endopeptidase [Legionella worsleiensis]KTD81580.1 CAAX amino terminal protease self- immunity [Legionella worsleiensis]STY32140.1 exosortase E/protease, VPEID-CTERM system [Legionella worsleiensis]